MNLGLRGKMVIISGGSKGIGLGCCKVFAEEGCNIVMNFRSDEEGANREAQTLYRRYGVNVMTVKADVSVEEEVKRLFNYLDDEGAEPCFLINNAADTRVRQTPFQDIATDDWRHSQEGTLNSAFFMSREFVKRLIIREQSGSIVNVLSKSAFLSSSIYNSAYATAKGGLAVFTRSLAKEVAAKGIRVNGIIPGYVKTERNYRNGDPRTEEKRRILPSGEFAAPKDIGAAAAFLCSDAVRNIMNGALLDCTGGTLI